MCSPTAAISGGLQVAQGYAGWQAQQAQYAGSKSQINIRNRALRNQYNRTIEQQNTEWNNTLKIWNQKLDQYQKQLERNMDAAYGYGGAYMGLQVKTNEKFTEAAFQSQAALSKLYKTLGAAQATAGFSGKTAERMDVMNFGAWGRETAIRENNLTRTIEGQKLDQANVRRQLESANNRAWQSVSVAPVPGRRPAPPTLLANPVAPSPWGAITQTATGLFGVADKAGVFGIASQDKALGINPGTFGDYGSYAGSANLFGTGAQNLGGLAGLGG